MKKLYFLKSIILASAFMFCFYNSLSANWQKSDKINSVSNTPNLPNGKAGTQHSDSLPNGVTEDWLNNLLDENGNRISGNEQSRAPGQIPEDPEGDALQRKIFNGLIASSQFGFSVSSAGDVNGDGYDDVIIGAYGYNSFTGRAYIYYGGQNMNTVADVTLTGTATSNFFGYSVSKAGDVNGDGYSDVIVGAYGYTTNTGRAYIYYGGAVMNNTVDVTLTGETTSNFFGISVSNAGDVNGDGYSDVIVGANGYSSNTGKCYIYFGGASMNNVVDVTMTGGATNNTFGTSVASAGDVNADGYSDVIIGANGYSSSTGRAYIFLGGNNMDNTADVTMTGEASNNFFGASVSSAGDVDGDGYSDVIVGAYGRNSFTGKAYIFYGGASMNSVSDVIFIGEANVNYFGASVSSAGDINGDGYSDVIIGAYGNNSNTGKVYVYFGAASMDSTADVKIAGETTNSNFGYSVGLAGDLNGDGYSDLLVGAYGYGSNTGRAYFYDYFMKNEIIPEITFSGAASNSFGSSVSSADVNSDGYPDIIVGASGYNSNFGGVFIFLGGPNMDNIADITFNGEAAGTNFGSSISNAGDVNGDGFADLIVGAYSYNSNTGRSYIYYGGDPMNNVADVVMNGILAQTDFGISVSTAGDVNGDGFSDVIVGADGYFNLRGKAFIFLGSSAMDNVIDVTFLGDSTYSYLGSSVACAGDVNGDGYSDVIVGNSSPLNSYFGRGEAYIFYGGAVMDNVKDVHFTGEASSNYFGSSVATAGDFNNDGFSDVIVGAYGYNGGSGRAYIYLGGNMMDNIPDVIITGEYNSGFGNSVASAGDINADGFSDVIVGASAYNSNKGKAYIFYGGTNPDDVADVTMTGGTTENLGKSVFSAGDINGDGYSDIIVGANGFNSNAGRSYIYTGSAISAKPILLHVKDVPNDQGGFVNLKWARSSFDVNGTDLITNYTVERSFPPSGGNFAWVNMANIPAGKNSFYSYLAATPFDSSSNSSGTFFFRVTAKTNSPSQYWRSAILSGRSLDNISPPMLSPFMASAEINNVRLNWKRSSAPDLLNYVLYRSVSNSIDPYTETPLNILTDSTYLDTAPLTGLYYYFVVAQDIHNNLSPVAIAQAPATSKSLFLFGAIQGLYDANTDVMIYDTVTVYLRNSTFPFAKIDSSRKELYGPGTGQNFTFINAQNNVPYYVEVKHRNALETWSADPVTFVSDNASIAFSVDAIYAYGNNEIQVDASPYNVFALYSGDVNQDGTIDLADGSLIDNDAFIFASGYLPTDLNGDGVIDLADAVFTDNNGFNFISKITP
ncbi:MAG: FG-GAP repeat protein [Bacteroidetes bacterium]|nr:FG-GAP repeat protein [Bacteroidota bacterium]